jgi:hypothetical protein
VMPARAFCVSVCTSKASKVSTVLLASSGSLVLRCLCIRQHTSAYVSIRQHTSAYVSIRQHTSAYVSIRQHTSAYVSIRKLSTGGGSKVSTAEVHELVGRLESHSK